MAKKKLILIGGPMGVGKTTLGKYLVDHRLNQAVLLDGDWCWYMHPWIFNDENKKMVMRNSQFLLNSFIANSTIETIVFVWVMHQQAIIDDLLSGLEGDFTTDSFSLVANEAELTKRFSQDIASGKRKPADLPAAIQRLSLYESVDSTKIDVTGRDYPEVAQLILDQVAGTRE